MTGSKDRQLLLIILHGERQFDNKNLTSIQVGLARKGLILPSEKY